MLRKKISFIAPHSAAECVELLKPCVDTSFLKLGQQPFTGKITESNLVIKKRLVYNNGFQTVLEARMIAGSNPEETQIIGHIGLQRGTIYFGAFWLLFALLAAIFGSIPLLISYLGGHADPNHGNIFVGILVPPGMLLFAFLLVSFGRWLARGEEAVITDFMKLTLQAEPSIIS